MVKAFPGLRSEQRDANLSAFLDPYARGQIPPNSYSPGGVFRTVTADTAMRVGAVWACVRLLSDVVSQLPVDAYRTIGGVSTPISQKPKLLVEPMPGQGFDEWISQAMISALLRGNTYGIVTQIDGGGYPIEVILQDPSTVRVVDGPNAVALYKVGPNQLQVDAATMMHFRARRMPGSHVGMSPIEYAARTISLGISVESFGLDWFDQGAHPSATLTNAAPLNDGQAQEAKNRLMNKIRGNREPLVLGAGWKLEPWQVSPNESQFLETIKANVSDIARIYGVPPEMIGGSAGNSMTYANVEQRALDFLTYSVDWWLTRWENFLTRMLPRPQYVKFNRNALLRTDTTSRYAAHDTAVRGGWKSTNEVRADEDLPSIGKDGDQYLWPPYALKIDAVGAGSLSSGTPASDSNPAPPGGDQ